MSLPQVKVPYFLVGAERSGTTLLRLMLDHHPKVAFNLESEYFVSQISADGLFPRINDYHEWLSQDRVFSHSRFTLNKSLNFSQLLNDFLRQKLERDGKEKIGATVHYGFSKLRLVWPEAKYVYIYRDPRDVVASVMQIGWAGNAWIAADWWMDAEREWGSLKGVLGEEQWLEVQYEDLIHDPAATLRAVCKFMGVAYSDKMFEYTRLSSYDYPDPRLAYKWRSTMNARDVSLVEQKLMCWMNIRGYEASIDKLAQPSHIKQWSLKVHSKVVVAAKRMKKFGFLLYLQEFFARRLGFQQRATKLNKRIDAIIQSQIK